MVSRFPQASWGDGARGADTSKSVISQSARRGAARRGAARLRFNPLFHADLRQDSSLRRVRPEIQPYQTEIAAPVKLEPRNKHQTTSTDAPAAPRGSGKVPPPVRKVSGK